MSSGLKHLLAYSTGTFKAINQDACTKFSNDSLDIYGVVIADGIGSHARSEVGSQFAVNTLSSLLSEINSLEELDFYNLFSQLKSKFIEYVGNDGELNKLDVSTSFGTTLICAVSTPNEFVIAYAGNGAAWHVRGDINDFPPHYLLPWSAVNHLSPHSVPERGKPALYNYLSASESVDFYPTEIRISKKFETIPRAIILMTDGVYALDGEVCGQSDDGNVWIPGGRNLLKMYEYLKPFYKNNETTEADLDKALNDFVAYMKDEKWMDDDTTLAMILER